MGPEERKKLIRITLVVFASLSALALLLFILGRGQPAVEEGTSAPEIDMVIEDSIFDPTINATISDEGDQLNKQLNYANDSYMALTTDLHVFGRTAYDAYKSDPNRPVGFEITSEVEKDGDVLTFDGHYGSSDNKVSVRIELLNHERFAISITDTVTGLNIDNQLPSNSKENQFIGSLPIGKDGYNVTYVSGNTINIGLYRRDPALRDRAYQDIRDTLGEEAMQKLNITLSFPSQSFGL